ncbi:MAG: hypothetical protein PVJ13_06915 [Desulfobacterales bacterium]|jgi:hypothetical protein
MREEYNKKKILMTALPKKVRHNGDSDCEGYATQNHQIKMQGLMSPAFLTNDINNLKSSFDPNIFYDPDFSTKPIKACNPPQQCLQ